jgi:hypothetical protein
VDGYNEIGVFTLKGNQMIVSDPCYDEGTWCQALLDNVKDGAWLAFALGGDVEGWGPRIKELYVIHKSIAVQGETTLNEFIENLNSSDRWEEIETTLGVDSGQLGFFEPSLYKKSPTWLPAAFEATVTEGYPAAGMMDKAGVVSSAGFGDGSYVCEVLTAPKSKERLAARVVFIKGKGETVPPAQEVAEEEEAESNEPTPPLYKHDCESCRYLGKYHTKETWYDLYYCGTHEKRYNNTVIGRFGNDGPDYCSGMSFAEIGHEPYAEARRRAISFGYYNPVELPLVAPSEEVKDVIVMVDHLISAMAKSWMINTQPGQDLALRELDRLASDYNDEKHTENIFKAFKEYLKSDWKDDE